MDIYSHKRICKSLHDFSLLLSEMCYINYSDLSREGRVENPAYYLEGTDISGCSTDRDVTIWFAKGMLPLSRDGYDLMKESLGKLNISVENEPEMVCYPVDFNYVLRMMDDASTDNNIIGSISPEPECASDFLMLHYDRIRDAEYLENILEAVLSDGFKIAGISL